MIELQGSLTTSTPNLTTPIHLGHLVFPDPPPSSASASAREGQRVHLFIGDHQRMTGEMKPLARPVAVVRRRGGAPDAEDLEIAEVVYYKILFAHRPEPVGALGAEGGGDGGDGEEGGGRG
jgi:chromosome transmission fidelity protein 8